MTNKKLIDALKHMLVLAVRFTHVEADNCNWVTAIPPKHVKQIAKSMSVIASATMNKKAGFRNVRLRSTVKILCNLHVLFTIFS